MTRLGFLLDSDNCIGCHACTVACKSEHDVPLGVNRTWVKYIETGTFPDVARKFNVMRCNQCDDAPCMTICPTNALFRSDNGVVDFQDDDCIGCKSCMNACPYDALYINPETNTAHKCNMCNHRLEQNLEPSCQIVCPTEAIIIGDLDDPTSKISQMISRNDVAVRAPEQNTKPKVFYKGADQAALDPTRTAIANDGMIWADTTPNHPSVPVTLGKKPTELDGVVARTAYTVSHKPTWGQMVSGYLVTKAVAGGAMMIAALQVLLGNADAQASVGIMAPIVATIFLVITSGLLIGDLKQPKRFYYLLTKGNFSSWLVKGAYVLMAFGLVTAVWFIAGLAESESLLQALAVPAAITGAATAGYTAFLFAQCEGRDLWQTPLLLPVLLARAVVAGASAWLITDLFIEVPSPDALRWALIGGVVAVLALSWMEAVGSHSRHVEIAVHNMVSGKHSSLFWGGIIFGVIIPLVLGIVALSVSSATAAVSVGAIAGLFALLGMFMSETAFVRAGQSVPLS